MSEASRKDVEKSAHVTKKVVYLHANEASFVGKFSFYSHYRRIIYYTVQVEVELEEHEEKLANKMKDKLSYSIVGNKK